MDNFELACMPQYFKYVAQERVAAKAAGKRVVGYMTFAQWFDHAVDQADADLERDELDFERDDQGRTYEEWQDDMRGMDPTDEFPSGEFAPQCNIGPLW